MLRKNEKKLIVGLDIGTSKVVAIVAELMPDNEIEVIGIGSNPSHGLKKGVVVNIDSTVQSIQRAVEQAELMAGRRFTTVMTGISGSHIRSINSNGIVAVKNREVVPSDVDRVIDAARAVSIPADQQILHILPQQFTIDSQDGIKDPVGMAGIRLEARVHLVTGAVSAVQNIYKCVAHCDLEVGDLILEQLSSAMAVLKEDEREMGVCLVDIGGGTTDIAIFLGGTIRHTAVIPAAGDQVTNDIAVALRTPTQSAEEIKLRYGCALHQLIADGSEEIDVQSIGDHPPRKLSRQTLVDVIAPRYQELFELVHAELRRCGLEHAIAAGVVITGGSSKMPGVVELAEEVFHMPVRLGTPRHVQGLSEVVRDPIYATGVGLLLYGRKSLLKEVRDLPGDHSARSVWGRMKSWFQGNF